MSSEDIPIDIHYNKLLDWLVSRRHCKQQWQGDALQVREKINTAIQDMPPVEEITQLLQGTYINYFHCKRISELLKSTDDGAKNLFGRYSSQRMKDWMDILKLYEVGDTYLAEAAQMLMRNVNYEIPALKKQIAKFRQAQADCTRKEGEHASYSAELKDKFQTNCKQMGIQGKKIRKELLLLVEDLPTQYDKFVEDSKGLKDAVAYYSAFVAFTLGSQEQGDRCLPLLKFIMDRGNVTCYEWRTGRTPDAVEPPVVNYSVNDEDDDEAIVGDAEDVEIDWGNIDEPASDVIDFDISVEDSGGVCAEGGSAEDGVDWGIEGTASSDLEESKGEFVAKGTDALSIMDNTETRDTFIDEMMELEAFLGQRLVELEDDSDMLSASQLQSAPRAVQLERPAAVAMVTAVRALLKVLTSKRMQDFFLIRSSPRYVDRLAESLKKIQSDSEKAMSLSRLMVIRRQEAVEEERATLPKLELIRKRTKELQKQIEGDISKKYKNRRVNIMGEINTV